MLVQHQPESHGRFIHQSSLCTPSGSARSVSCARQNQNRSVHANQKMAMAPEHPVTIRGGTPRSCAYALAATASSAEHDSWMKELQ